MKDTVKRRKINRRMVKSMRRQAGGNKYKESSLRKQSHQNFPNKQAIPFRKTKQPRKFPSKIKTYLPNKTKYSRIN